MKRELTFAVPGRLDTPTGGYAYDRRIIAELSACGWIIEVAGLGEGFPNPEKETLKRAGDMLLAVPAGRPVVVDGLALGVMDEAAASIGARGPLIALVHHPLAFETGVPPAAAALLRESERKSLAASHAVIVTSRTTGATLTDHYGVPADKITVAPPGTDPAPLARGSGDDSVHLLAVGTISQRKGYDVLLAALAANAALPWRLTIAGARDRDPVAVARLDADIARFGFESRVRLFGAVTPEHLARLYDEADLFVLASHYEGYGMAYVEAVSRGIPVVGTTGGAIPEAVPAGAGLLVPPDDVGALASALCRLIDGKAERQSLAAGARRAAASLPSWSASAQCFAQTIERVQ